MIFFIWLLLLQKKSEAGWLGSPAISHINA